MANKSAQNTSIFKKAFGLLKSDTAISAGIKSAREGVDNRLTHIAEATNLIGQGIADGIDKAEQAKILEKLKSTYGFKGVKEGENINDALLKFRKELVDNTPSLNAFDADPKAFIKDDKSSMLDFAKGTVKDYYTNGTTTERGARIGATTGAYVGGALGMRMLSGGTVTRNANGERDVAGIPFV